VVAESNAGAMIRRHLKVGTRVEVDDRVSKRPLVRTRIRVYGLARRSRRHAKIGFVERSLNRASASAVRPRCPGGRPTKRDCSVGTNQLVTTGAAASWVASAVPM